ncbi:Hypothetical protein GbCGDNIH9_1259 [Granulibacter bethesdensis]|uniref:SPOR domain-containing protein n=1 Tax=Granulibacter bethesdensis TaxID=364410 RepID=A0AAC9P8H7_9PROT|nr:SPOR domain-containing protein [Granulibacter bethesdensis]APH54557.1 Hypothetical protein GbCGDNIH9_1259 [Granulibacter bethesdensis]APH62143.1 Hypothetical protein GbCGDNIH8_1259 [Granulibacter bethesdensis]
MPDHTPNESPDPRGLASDRPRVRQAPRFDPNRVYADEGEAMGGPEGFRMPRIDLQREDLRTRPTDDLLPGVEEEAAYRSSRRATGGGGLDPATRKLAMAAGAIGVALVGFIGLWSLLQGTGGPVPVIEADNRPLRVKPANPGGMQISGADDAILSGASDDAPESLAPKPEAPMPGRLAPPSVPQPLPPVSGSETTEEPVMQGGASSTPKATADSPAVSGRATEQKAPASVKPPVTTEDADDETPSAPTPKTASQGAAKPAPSVAPASNGHVTVQLAALNSEDAAHSEWNRLSRRMPDLLGHRQPSISKTEHDGKTYWRLRTGGFADVAAAKSFCAEVRAKGGGCSVATF